MTKQWLAAVTMAIIFAVTGLHAAEDNRGQLGSTSTGLIELSLQVTGDISAGLLQTNLDEGSTELQSLLSTQLVQSLRNDSNTTLPLCILSRGGGYFEVTSYEIPGEEGNQIVSGFGSSVPVEIRFGEQEQESVKYQSVTEDCNQNTAIPVTIRLKQQLSGAEIGTIRGRFNLLVKSE